MTMPKRILTLPASCLALFTASSLALAQVKPALPPPDRPGLNPPRVFPPDKERPIEFPYQAQPAKAALMIVTAHPDDEGMFPGLIPYIPFKTKTTNMGLYVTAVGPDTKKTDMFENIDLSAYAPKSK